MSILNLKVKIDLSAFSFACFDQSCVLSQLRFNRLIPFFLMIVLTIGLTACQTATPPTELTPDGEIVQKAIALQLSKTEERLSQQLNTSVPILEISKIQVKQNEPVFIEDLAAYHLTGTYRLKLKLPHQEVTQRQNPFDIYLQRQAEGKTWRLLRREVKDIQAEPQWSSYLIQ